MAMKPIRRYEVDIHIGADDRKSFVSALQSILFNIEAYKEDDQPVNLVSGGYDSGYSVMAHVDTSITHDSWEKELEAYMADFRRNEEQQP